MKTFTNFSISRILGENSEIETETNSETAFGEISFKQFSANYFFSYQLTMLNLIYFPDKYQLMCFFPGR